MIEYTPLGVGRGAAQLQDILDQIAAAPVEGELFGHESLDRTVLPARPVWDRLSTQAISVRNVAALAVAGAMTDVVHNGTTLGFTFVNYPVLAGDAVRFGAWLSFESTLSSGLGFTDGDLRLQWTQAGVGRLAGSSGGLQRGAFAGALEGGPSHHGQAYIEGWILGPVAINTTVRVQYTLAAAGARGFLSRSVVWHDHVYRSL